MIKYKLIDEQLLPKMKLQI